MYSLIEKLSGRITNNIKISHGFGFIRHVRVNDNDEIVFDYLYRYDHDLPFFNRMLKEGEDIEI